MGSDPDILLKSTALFSSCTDEDLAVIASHSGFLDIRDGDTVFAGGDKPERLYIIDGGEIVIRKDNDEGRPVDIARFLTGDCFGELDMFTGELRNAAAYASGDVSLLVFPDCKERFSEILTTHPNVSARLLHAFLVQISARIRGVNALVKENSPLVQELKRQVYVDKLTGLYNKTCFDETLDRVIKGEYETIGLLMYKPDNFKTINDSYGHDAGDKVLRRIADGLCELVPDRDMLFRYMGNENAVILPGAGREEVFRQAEIIGDFLRSIDLAPFLDGDKLTLSVSFGLGVVPEHGSEASTLVEAVHPLALEGRHRGGNLCMFPEDSTES